MMKNTIAAGLLAVAVPGAATAHGDDPYYPFSGPMGDHDASAYWVDISSTGRGTVADAAQIANNVCTSLENGMSEGDIIAAAVNGNQSEISGATLIVHAAEWHFCPQYY